MKTSGHIIHSSQLTPKIYAKKLKNTIKPFSKILLVLLIES